MQATEQCRFASKYQHFTHKHIIYGTAGMAKPTGNSASAKRFLK